MPDLNDYETAMAVRDAVRNIAQSAVNDLVSVKLATVQSVDRNTMRAYVIMQDDTTPTQVNFSSDDGPWGKGDLVFVNSQLGWQQIETVIFSATAPGGCYVGPAIWDMALGGGKNRDRLVSHHWHSEGGNPGAGSTWYFCKWNNLTESAGLAEVILTQGAPNIQVAKYTIPLFKVLADGNWYTAAPNNNFNYPSGYSVDLQVKLSNIGTGYCVEFRALQNGAANTNISLELTIKGNWTEDLYASEGAQGGTSSGTLATYDSSGVLTGSVTMYAGSGIPTGYLFCDGSAVSRTTYSKLFTAIGTTWGGGDGSTTFNLPNFTGSFPLGNSLGAYGGSSTGTGSGSGYHNHSLSYQGQALVVIGNAKAYVAKVPVAGGWYASDELTPSSETTSYFAPANGASLAGYTDSAYDTVSVTVPTMPPYVGLNFIIKT